MALKITEVQQSFANDTAKSMTVKLACNQKGKSTDQMILCANRADTYDGLGTKTPKAVTWNGTVATASFTESERTIFTGEMYVLIDSGTGGSHDLCNICCIYINAPVLTNYRVTEQNELMLYPDQSKRDTQLAFDMHCTFSGSGQASSHVLGWNARLELYNLQDSASVDAELRYSHTDKTANASVFGPGAKYTFLIAPPNIKTVICTAQIDQTASSLTASAEGSSMPTNITATLYSHNRAIADKELTKSSSTGTYTWTGLPKLDPSGEYSVSFRSKSSLGLSRFSKSFPVLADVPLAESCEFSDTHVTILMAREAAYNVKIGTTSVIHTGKAIVLSSIPNADPEIRLTRDDSFGPALTCKLSNPAYYSFTKTSGETNAVFYQYAEKPMSDCCELELTLAVNLPTHDGTFFKASAKELVVKADAFSPVSLVSEIHADYITLLNKCTGSTQILAIRSALLAHMPMRAEDFLFYRYHYSPSGGYTDLWPGMTLEATYAGYQYIPDDLRANILAQAPVSDGGTFSYSYDGDLNGYVGSGTERFSLVDRGGKLRFEPFVSGLTDSGWLTVPPPSDIGDNNNLCGGAGVLDLLFAGMKAPFLRLAYPQTVTERNSAGSLKFYENVCLMAADTTALLDEAMGLMRRDSGSDTMAQAFVSGVVITYFRGRAAVIPKIRIDVNGTPAWVSVGTVLGDVLRECEAVSASLRRQGASGLCLVPGAEAGMPLLAGDSICVK